MKEANYWKNLTNQKNYLENVFKILKLNDWKDWYKVILNLFFYCCFFIFNKIKIFLNLI